MQEFHKTAHEIFSTCFQSLWGFSKQMDNNVEMTVALKLGVQKSNIVDPSNIGCVSMHSVWYTAEIKKSQVCLGCQIVIIITI